MPPYRIVLADDHAILRRGIKKIIQEKKSLQVVGEAGDGAKLLELLDGAHPQMIILDISMPHFQGIEAAEEIKKNHPGVKILILTMHKNKEFLHHVISAGIEGYLLKEDADTELFTAIDRIRRGGTYISPLLSVELAREFGQRSREGAEPVKQLTAREIEVLKLIAEGKSSKEIADRLNISIRTVHHHRDNILHKLNISNIAHLIKYAIRKGYSSPFI